MKDKGPNISSNSISTKDSEISSTSDEIKINLKNEITDLTFDIETLPLTAHNHSTQLSFLRKVYIAVILQTIFTIMIVYMFNSQQLLNTWISLPNMSLISLSVSFTLILVISFITYAAPEFVRDSTFISFMLLFIFGIFMGTLVHSFGRPLYMYSVYGGFVLVLTSLIIYTFFADLKFNFFSNFIVCLILCSVYFLIIIGYLLNNYVSVIPALLGSTFFSFYSIFFSQFAIGRESTLYRKGDYIFGALKFNLDFAEVVLKVLSIFIAKLNCCAGKTNHIKETVEKDVSYNSISK